MKAHKLKKMFTYTAIFLLFATMNTSIVNASISENDEEVKNRYSFTEKELEKETNLYYFNARHYNPKIGRFTSTDPAGGLNRYIYCENNPLKYIDPSGEFLVEPENNQEKSTWGDFKTAVKNIFSSEMTEEEIAREQSKPSTVSFDLGVFDDRISHANYVLVDWLLPWKINEDHWHILEALLGITASIYAGAQGSGRFGNSKIKPHIVKADHNFGLGCKAENIVLVSADKSKVPARLYHGTHRSGLKTLLNSKLRKELFLTPQKYTAEGYALRKASHEGFGEPSVVELSTRRLPKLYRIFYWDKGQLKLFGEADQLIALKGSVIPGKSVVHIHKIPRGFINPKGIF